MAVPWLPRDWYIVYARYSGTRMHSPRPDSRPLHDRYTTVTRPLHDRYTTVARPLRDRYIPIRPHPARLSPLALETVCAVAVACGSAHSAALVAGGFVLAWGDNTSGQCGAGGPTVGRASYSLAATLVDGVTIRMERSGCNDQNGTVGMSRSGWNGGSRLVLACRYSGRWRVGERRT